MNITISTNHPRHQSPSWTVDDVPVVTVKAVNGSPWSDAYVSFQGDSEHTKREYRNNRTVNGSMSIAEARTFGLALLNAAEKAARMESKRGRGKQ